MEEKAEKRSSPPTPVEKPAPPVEETSSPFDWGIYNVAQGLPVFLVPLARKDKQPASAAEDVWKDMPRKFSTDEAVRVRLTSLAAAEAVEIKFLSGPPDTDFVPAKKAFDTSRVFLGLWETDGRTEPDSQKDAPPVFTTALAFGYFQGKPAPNLKGDLQPYHLLIALLNDYFLRTDSGYFVVHGRYDPGRYGNKVKAIRGKSPEELRQDLEAELSALREKIWKKPS